MKLRTLFLILILTSAAVGICLKFVHHLRYALPHYYIIQMNYPPYEQVIYSTGFRFQLRNAAPALLLFLALVVMLVLVMQNLNYKEIGNGEER